MYGILFTMHTGHVASMEHIDSIPSKEIAESIKKEWFTKNDKYKDYASAVIYDMEKSEPAKEQPLFCYSTSPARAIINLTQEQLADKVDILCSKLDTLQMAICDDATSTPRLVEFATIVRHIAHELWDALPDDEQDNENFCDILKKTYTGNNPPNERQ